MTVGAVADPAEREAERIADQVVSSLARPVGEAQRAAGEEEAAIGRAGVDVRRVSAEDEEELMASRSPVDVRRVSAEDEEELMASRDPSPTAVGPEGGQLDDGTAAAIARARGSGEPLTDGVRRSMESAFGADLSGVRVHTDSRAHDLNGTLRARAFTVGSDIFFRRGDYQPDSTPGRKLLAHELTHVVQQGGAGSG
jgi:hypothetical protein